MAGNNLILMVDRIDGGKTDRKEQMESFKIIVAYVNKINQSAFLLPLTITPDDTFQCVVKDLSGALKIIIDLEEDIIIKEYDLKLRYALVEREIETPLDPKVAYGLLGSTLTAAKGLLKDKESAKNRFGMMLRDKNVRNVLGNCFTIFQKLVDSWRIDMDYHIVSGFICGMDYKEVARVLGKARSLIWKREKSLYLPEYFAIKKVIHYLGE